ncbi:MAG: hypothetical protein AAF456_10520 [Planctomycetota bacterium]
MKALTAALTAICMTMAFCSFANAQEEAAAAQPAQTDQITPAEGGAEAAVVPQAAPAMGGQVIMDQGMVYGAPVYQGPVYQPMYQQPMYQQPMYHQPMYQQPMYHQPMYQQPMYHQPMYQQPMYYHGQIIHDPYMVQPMYPQYQFLPQEDPMTGYSDCNMNCSQYTTAVERCNCYKSEAHCLCRAACDATYPNNEFQKRACKKGCDLSQQNMDCSNVAIIQP